MTTTAPDLFDKYTEAEIAAAPRLRTLRAQISRHDADKFCQFVLRDERNGRRIKQAPMHTTWHRIIDRHDRVVFWSHVEGGKTNQIVIGRTLYELGRDPNLRVAIISNTTALAEKMVRSCAQYIEKSADLHEVFPHLVPAKDPGLPWNNRAITIHREVVGGKDPSIQACGVHGNIIGSRIDLLVIDDILDYENTRTPTPRVDVWNWIRSGLFSRLTENARVIVVGNAWHPEDALHKMSREPRFVAYRFPVISPKGELTWPERWSHERIQRARADLGPLEYARQLLCQARDDDSARFRKEWLDACEARGRGLRLVHSAAELAKELGCEEEAKAALTARRLGARADVLNPLARLGIRIFTGVDLAVQRHAAADLTSFFTIAVFPNGDRRVLNIESGRWSAPEITAKAIDHHMRYGSTLIVENVGAQHYIVDLIRERSSAPVVPFTTGRTKAHPEFGVEGLAAEFHAAKWIIPFDERIGRSPEIDAWLSELLMYDPMAHTGDRVMACWFAREGARGSDGSSGGASVTIITGDDEDEPEPGSGGASGVYGIDDDET